MANFDEIKKAAAEKAEMLAGKAAGLARTTAEKAKVMAKIGKLNAEILAEKENVRKANQELGKIYYEYFRVDPHEPMKEACEKLDASYALIAAKRAEIEELKNENPEYSYDDVYDDEDIEVEIIAEEAAQEAAEAAGEAAEAAAEAAQDAADACTEEKSEE